ncbi:imidazole glycerol phosphate synthase subunit HisF [Alkalibacter rhizosphaerae]|uniref:Imidazole glycerol phosphate synthase subunit HisF n=1 Tax=Alkalibacter rhizosphaerae TaxID=2815577 RepID=A0A975AHI6_9FIRM|nr:imidazole glycerol phosphate synthase subunit HisF [Alkalibacter rhizosphaerae]QSX08497.1 imidazole glycerol phosphate synthase subunit HisF [Alkalibacter rhizosphaerae]
MKKVRIMPCLDMKDGRVVKGVHFVDLQDAGDPVEIAKAYNDNGADELAFLDIAATIENRKTTLEVVRKISEVISIPFTVGGGIGSVEDAKMVLSAGADRVSLSSAAFRRPDLINKLSETFGSDKVVVAIDVDINDTMPSGYEVFVDGGNTATGKDAVEWAIEAERRGAGYLLPTSKARDGAKNGYDIPLLMGIKERTTLPVIASGGAGKMEHFLEAVEEGKADILLAASVFHFGEIKIDELKRYLNDHGVETP